GDFAVRCDLADTAVIPIADEDVARRVHDNAVRRVQAGRFGGSTVAGEAGRAVSGDGIDLAVGRDAAYPMIAEFGEVDAAVRRRGPPGWTACPRHRCGARGRSPS